MKKQLLFLLAMLMCATQMMAQRRKFTMVTPAGTTTYYNTIQAAVEAATDGSTIYVPDGNFEMGDLFITKKLNIIGMRASEKVANTGAYSRLVGDIYFKEGTSASTVLGVRVSNIYFDSKQEIEDLVIKQCVVGSIKNLNKTPSFGININQTIVDVISMDGSSDAYITNCVFQTLNYLYQGLVDHCVIIYGNGARFNYCKYCTFSNLLFGDSSKYLSCQYNQEINCVVSNSFTSIFVDYKSGDCPHSDFHIKESSDFYGRDLGVMGGTGFTLDVYQSSTRVVDVMVPDHTDDDGKLKVKVKVETVGE